MWMKIYLFGNSASLRPHQRHFFLQKMAINTETLSWSMCRKQTSECSTLNGKALSQLSPQGSGIYAERLQDPEVANNLKKIGFSKTCLSSTEIKPSMKKGGRHEAHP